MLTVNNLDFEFADRDLLNHVQFSLVPGQLLHIQGDNGVGKTTLLRILAGLLTPLKGSIDYLDQGKCYVGHRLGVNPCLTIREHWHLDLVTPETQNSFQKAMTCLHLTHQADMLCGILSQGQQRRVSFLRLLASPAILWLLDEPFASLDAASIVCLSTLLQAHLQQAGMVILTSHQDLPFEATDSKVLAL